MESVGEHIDVDLILDEAVHRLFKLWLVIFFVPGLANCVDDRV